MRERSRPVGDLGVGQQRWWDDLDGLTGPGPGSRCSPSTWSASSADHRGEFNDGIDEVLEARIASLSSTTSGSRVKSACLASLLLDNGLHNKLTVSEVAQVARGTQAGQRSLGHIGRHLAALNATLDEGLMRSRVRSAATV